jgi:hypothetical protein
MDIVYTLNGKRQLNTYMKKFKQFLLETEQTLNPRRSDYPEGDSGQQQYLQALRDTAKKQKQEAEEMTRSAESRANILGNIETGLKVADAVTDVALTAGSVLPGGALLNAGVKATKSAVAAGQGNYTGVAVNALDAAVPIAGKLATAVKAAGNIASVINNPITGGVRVAANKAGLSQAISSGVQKLGVSELAANAAGKGLGSATQKTSVALGQSATEAQKQNKG